MPNTIVSIGDGTRTTVQDLIGNPLVIPTKIVELLDNALVADALLRDAGSNGSGLVQYSERGPQILDGEIADLAEFAEIPVAAGQVGLPRVLMSAKKGLGVRVSKDMIDKNQIDAVNRQITQLANTFLLMNVRLLLAALNNPAIPSIVASAAWNDPAGKPRHDLALAQEKVASGKPSGAQAEEFLGFEADTVVMPGGIRPVLMDNPDFLSVYKDSLASESISYTGKLPSDVLGMGALTARSWPNKVLVCERKTLGFYSDARKLQSTGMYPEGNGPNGGPTESFRTDTTQERAVGIDAPLAACWITGIVA